MCIRLKTILLYQILSIPLCLSNRKLNLEPLFSNFRPFWQFHSH